MKERCRFSDLGVDGGTIKTDLIQSSSIIRVTKTESMCSAGPDEPLREKINDTFYINA